jgi:uncharacterized paraquat-inducible protein A
MDEWDKILNDVDLEETKEEYADEWWCHQCEMGPMAEKEDKCTRCGARRGKIYDNDADGWEEPYVEDEVEEIW